MTKVKVCGITNYEDAAHAAILGSDYLGFNFYELSPRYIDESEVKKFIGRLPKNVRKVGVFVNQNLDAVKKIVENLDLDLIQLHGDETQDYCSKLKAETKKQIIKAFRIKDKNDINKIKNYNVDYLMFDAYKEGMFGGTGRTFDWKIIKGANKPFFLSGGLNPKNVKEAIRIAKPYAVDVASGVEANQRKKDYNKIKEFIECAKQ
ncbi:MAG: phosphoribosylanthranilate isomerase [Nanoarchaeota archaeon]|mgnify:CR=1 FL=1